MISVCVKRKSKKKGRLTRRVIRHLYTYLEFHGGGFVDGRFPNTLSGGFVHAGIGETGVCSGDGVGRRTRKRQKRGAHTIRCGSQDGHPIAGGRAASTILYMIPAVPLLRAVAGRYRERGCAPTQASGDRYRLVTGATARKAPPEAVALLPLLLLLLLLFSRSERRLVFGCGHTLLDYGRAVHSRAPACTNRRA